MRKLLVLLAVSTVLTLLALVGGSPADAAPAKWPCTDPHCLPGDIYGYVEASPSVNIRTSDCATSACGIVGQIAFGTRVAVHCYLRGDMVTGWGGTTDEWDLLTDLHSDGFVGWVSDAWINTGGDTATMVGHC